ncbi:MAG: hypothetical protein ACE5E5_10120 [Phycisphaerae bacterium]
MQDAPADRDGLEQNHKPNAQGKLNYMVIESGKGNSGKRGSVKRRKLLTGAALIATGIVFQAVGFLDGCNDKLVNLTYFVDPCGTFLANCNPGDFQSRNSPLGNPCVDPTCTIPGQCAADPNNPPPPLGTLFRLCD